jgi:hypothetical protein
MEIYLLDVTLQIFTFTNCPIPRISTITTAGKRSISIDAA